MENISTSSDKQTESRENKIILHFKQIYLIEWFFIGVSNENVKPQSLNTFWVKRVCVAINLHNFVVALIGLTRFYGFGDEASVSKNFKAC